MGQSSLKATFNGGHGPKSFRVKLVQFSSQFLPSLGKLLIPSEEKPALAKKRIHKVPVLPLLDMDDSMWMCYMTAIPLIASVADSAKYGWKK